MRWLKGQKVVEYDADNTDALKLAQAVAREGQPYDAVAWTLVQRFALIFPKYPTLAKFVEAYAQPVNPRWFPDGDLHIRRMKQLEGNQKKQADEQRRASNRRGYADKRWEELPAFARTAALEAIAASGDSPVPGSVHFRASMAPSGSSKRASFDRAKRYADNRPDLSEVVRIPEGYGNKVNWFFRSAGSNALRMLADGEDTLVPRAPDPKDDAPPGAHPQPSAPDGAPTGEGWGWVWSYLPSHSWQPETVGEEPPVSDSHSSKSDDDEGKLEIPTEEIPPGPIASIEDAPGWMGQPGYDDEADGDDGQEQERTA